MKILNSLNDENVKGAIWDFSTSILLQNIKKIEGYTYFGAIRKLLYEKRVAEQKLHKFDVSSTSVDIIKKYLLTLSTFLIMSTEVDETSNL